MKAQSRSTLADKQTSATRIRTHFDSGTRRRLFCNQIFRDFQRHVGVVAENRFFGNGNSQKVVHRSVNGYVEDQQGLRRFLPRKVERGERQAFNALCQSTGADHLRWLMNAMDREVCQQREFRDCHLILTVHDSLVYEVPKSVRHDFVRAARPVMNRRPYWADIDIKVDIEIGIRFGRMRKV